jgi:YD repeat-containing protein
MKKIKICIVYFFISTIFCGYAMGQDPSSISLNDYFSDLVVVPPTPASAELGLYGNVPVSCATGIPDISVHLYDVILDGVKVPISLSYHASGIRVDDISSCVGLKWSLNAGGIISRNINGRPDEECWVGVSDEYLRDCSKSSSWEWWCKREEVDAIAKNEMDLTPDDFSYSIMGNSGGFFLDNKGNLIQTNTSGFKFKPSSLHSFFEGFTANDLFGNTYSFKAEEYSRTETSDSETCGDYVVGKGYTGWLLNEIVTKNGKTLTFDYSTERISYSTIASQSYKAQENGSSDCCPENSSSTSVTSYDYTTALVTFINTPNEVVEFKYATDSSMEIWTKKLTEIIITPKEKEKPIRSIKFEYDNYSGSKRLRLRKVKWYDADSSFVKEQIFNYKTDQLPEIGSYAKDRFGYYNGANSNTSLIPVDECNSDQLAYPANRNISEYCITKGILNEIVYPTKGKTKFYYEANISGDKCAPGVRIKKQVSEDAITGKTNIVTFSYGELCGNTERKGSYQLYWLSAHEDDCCQGKIFRSFKYNNGNRQTIGHYYKTVRKNYCTYDDNSMAEKVQFYEEYDYIGIYSDLRLQPYLKEKRYYGAEGLVRKETYDNKDICVGGGKVVGYQLEPPFVADGRYVSCSEEEGLVFVPRVRPYYYRLNSLLWTTSDIKLLGKEVEDYRPDINYPIRQSWTYTYGANNMVNTVITTTSENSEIIKKTIKYPGDYENGIKNMREFKKNHNGFPIYIGIEKGSSEFKLLTSGLVNTYDSNGNKISEYQYNIQKEASVWNSKVYYPAGFEKKVDIKYSKGKTVETKLVNDFPVSYYYGRNHQYPLAKFENMTYATIVGNADLKAELDKLQNYTVITSKQRTAFNGLNKRIRSLVPGAMVYTSTFDPLIGMTSQTDPNGITTYYEYDAFGRLECVKDDEGNILKKYSYHYQNQ